MNKLLTIIIILLVAGCKEKFISPAPNVVTGYLVVEGVVNNGQEPTNIRLSRTTSLDDENIIKESGAIVKLESSNNTSLLLYESNEGSYTLDNLQLDTSLRYRLNVTTSNNEQFLSDYVPVIYNPPIDSINWVRENDGVQLYINTHNPNNNTRYYQWEYNETWEFHSPFSTSLKYVKGPPPDYRDIAVTYRDFTDPDIYTCWKNNSSNLILIGSSAKLSQDIIHLPIVLIENGAQKLSVLYSVLVTQYAWSKEGYDFLGRMKKNTESVGSVFDPQPSELNGNFHCTTNPNQPVIGFFNICTVQKNRIFIKNEEVPNWDYNSNCRFQDMVIIKNDPDSIHEQGFGRLPTTVKTFTPFGGINTFYAGAASCVDCTLSGTNVKPIFWP